MSSKAATPTAPSSATRKANSRRLDKSEKNVLVHLLQAPKLTNGDIARIIDVDERTISRRRKQLRTLGHLSPERNVKGAEKLRPWHLEVSQPAASCCDPPPPTSPSPSAAAVSWSGTPPFLDCWRLTNNAAAVCRESSPSSRRTTISS